MIALIPLLLVIPQIACFIILYNAEIITEKTTCVFLICSTVVITTIIITASINKTKRIENTTKTTAETAKSKITEKLTENLNAYKATNDSLASIEITVNKINENVDELLKEKK